MVIHDVSLLGDADFHLFNEGSHLNLWEKLGAHPGVVHGQQGTHFAVWAPEADRISVVGDFNDWRADADLLSPEARSGIWRGFIPGVQQGNRYKYHMVSKHRGYSADKADPFAVYTEVPPLTASVVWSLENEWHDAEWMAAREARQRLDAPIAIYEVHLGSWRRVPEEADRSLTYRELRRDAARVRVGAGLHARRAPAGDGASVLRVVGVSDDRLTSPRPAATARRRI